MAIEEGGGNTSLQMLVTPPTDNVMWAFTAKDIHGWFQFNSIQVELQNETPIGLVERGQRKKR